MTRIISLAPLAAVLALSSVAGAQEATELEALLARAREARPNAVRCKGSAQVSGAKHSFEFAFDGTGRLELALSGQFGATSGFDGERAWQVDERAGVPYDLDLYLGDAFRACYAVWTGDWCESSFDFEIEGPKRTGDVTSITLRSPRSSYEATLVLDAETLAPKTLTQGGWGGRELLRFANVVDGLAWRLERVDPAGNTDVFSIEGVEAYTSDANVACGVRPATTPRNVRFDSGVPAELEVKRARSGHLLVRPKIDDIEAGWFMFDTGAPITTISPTMAEKLGLSKVGKTYIGGAGSERKTVDVRRASSLELGPIRLENPVLTEFQNINSEASGVIGWDVLIHAIVEVDMQRATITIRPRDGYELPAGEWRDMQLHMRHPHVQASFVGGHEGLFRIDTGAGRLSVMFHNPTVQRLDMLADRKTTVLRAMGAGGPLDLRMGSLDWFEIAGHRTEQLQAIFCMDETGALADPDSLGNLGGGVLGPFVLVFDYQGRRVGFVRRDDLAAGD